MASLLKILDSRWLLWFVFFFAIVVHVILAWYDAYIALLPGGDKDALRFHGNAMEIAKDNLDFQFTMGAVFYDHVLGTFYKNFVANKFWGNLFSVAGSALAMFFFIKCMDTLNLKSGQSLFLFLFAFDPTILIHGSITLRESYELLFFVMAVFFLLRIIDSKSNKELFLFTTLFGISVCVLPYLHVRALAMFSYFVFIGFSILYLCLNRSREDKLIVVICTLSFCLFVWFAGGDVVMIYLSSPGSPDNFPSPGSLDYFPTLTLEQLKTYRIDIQNYGPRTFYPIALDFSNFWSCCGQVILSS